MRTSGKMLATVLDVIGKKVEIGATTKDMAIIASQELEALGGQPVFLGYQGFPDVICISVNDEIVHGIPSNRELTNGDLVSFDFGVSFNDMITDSAFTMIVGKNDKPEVKRLLDGTNRALYSGIDTLKDGVRVGDVSSAIEYVLTTHKLGIVRELVGHGVGHQLHEEPNIPNYGVKSSGPMLKKGMTVAIEPMAMLGKEDVATYRDGWTVGTVDLSLSAHFEHTVLITKNGAEIITQL
jgi:methionyl aminopeptidase